MTEPYDTPEISGSKYAQQPNDFLPYLLQHNDYCCPHLGARRRGVPSW